jgi:hypothetical protein
MGIGDWGRAAGVPLAAVWTWPPLSAPVWLAFPAEDTVGVRQIAIPVGETGYDAVTVSNAGVDRVMFAAS